MGATMSIVSAGVSLIAAKQKADAYKLQAQSYEEQRKQRQMQMDSQVIDRERTLFAQLAALRASGAARGATVGAGGTLGALKLNESNMARMDVNKIKVMGYSDMRQLSISSAISKQSAKAAMTSGFASGLGTIGTGIQNAPGITGGPAAGTPGAFIGQLKSEWT